jgi:hypothetical protein
MPESIETPTGAAQNGRTHKIMATLIDTVPSGVTVERTTIYFNGADTVPLRPGMNAPSVEVQPFQNGDSTNVTVDGGYSSDSLVCEYNEADYNSIDAARANALRWKIQRIEDNETSPSDTGIAAILTVSEGPTLNVNANVVPTMTVQIDYTGTQQNPLDVLPTA